MSTALPPIIENPHRRGRRRRPRRPGRDVHRRRVRHHAGRGPEAVRALLTKKFINDNVTLEVREVIDHHGDFIVRAKYDGTYDKANLPGELVMTSYFSIRGGKIVSLAIIFNQPSPY